MTRSWLTLFKRLEWWLTEPHPSLGRKFENFNRYPGNSLRRKLLIKPENDSLVKTRCLDGTKSIEYLQT